ncbi:DUF924 family protein [Synechocystis sp. PCC 7509]|uniref:DUF924 family protein n=1 Tax=Synechocystis sp. PCC 7509 TaxID=927677 RepID=UPI0002ACC9FA|nr:DUF924 family protein [Synechocystis sp. PCC 7509]
MKTQLYLDILRFWFPILPKSDRTAMIRQWQWWFRSGADAEIVEHFAPLSKRAVQGELDDWSLQPQSRLALIIILDQFGRSLYRGTNQAFAQDSKACALTLEGIALGHYEALKTPWEKTFFILPLGHSEEMENLDLVVNLAAQLAQDSSLEERPLLEFSAAQARRHQQIIKKFGRHPHRNEILGRTSTLEELEYLSSGQLVHQHPIPPHLAQLLNTCG